MVVVGSEGSEDGDEIATASPIVAGWRRRRRTPGKGLKDHLPRSATPTRIWADYTNAAQAARGIDALCRSSEFRKWHGVFLAALTDHPVLVLGKTGTGKEVVAYQIHTLSQRRTGPFRTVNCAAVPSDLFESELFGHLRGAFTGAYRDKQGLFESAANGTLFLDEVGDLALEHQAKVLRMLDDGEYRPVGSGKTRKGSARIIAATNRNLTLMVDAGKFREDLFYRLRSFPIRTPALNEHADDIPLLANYFWPKVTACFGEKKSLSGEVLELLKRYPWKGNARALRVFLEYVSTLANGCTPTPKLVRKAFVVWTGRPGERNAP